MRSAKEKSRQMDAERPEMGWKEEDAIIYQRRNQEDIGRRCEGSEG